MNVVSSPSSSPLLPPMLSIISKNTALSATIQSPSQPQFTINNKRKSSTSSTNLNRFDGMSEEELTKRILTDILQPNLDIVFVSYDGFMHLSIRIYSICHNYLFRWELIQVCMQFIKDIIMVDREIIFGNYYICLA